MKLSEIVRYRNHLDEITPGDLKTQMGLDIDPVIYAVENNELKLPHLVDLLSHDRKHIMDGIDSFKSTLEKTKQEVDQVIENIEPIYLSNSYRLYQEMQQDSTEYILTRRLALPESEYEYIRSRTQMFSDWRLTAAVIRPGLESWIECILGCDPLYLVDTDYALFEPVKKRFNDAYISRLRFYTIKESETDLMLDQLPDGQFSFILAYNFFHYKPFEVFKNYLTEIYKKLDSGGTLAFTFNDCDRWGGVDLSERWFMCYTPGRLLYRLCETLGYKIVNYRVMDNAVTWMEIQKPGQHVSIKGGQTLAEFLEKSK